MFIIQTVLSSFFIWCFIIAVLGLLRGTRRKNSAQSFSENKNCETVSEKNPREFSQNNFTDEAAENLSR
ncbi:MAG TPA: hypothetical protein DCS50_06310, partial [Acidaminococcaceae bacterium]|nr:hypothetical protein [Acidaminococcaceae bacterium]